MIILLILICIGMIDPVFAQPSGSALQVTSVSIPDGEDGIGFDDMTYSVHLHKVLIPAGHTGKLYLIDPITYAMTAIGGFSSSPEYQKGHDIGITSADEGEGFIFVLDHGRNEIDAIDPHLATTVATASLAGDSDYVRYIGVHHEIWVTEPHNKQIEVFKFSGGDHPKLSPLLLIPVEKGPESLMVDHLRGRAYTNLGPKAAAIDLQSHKIVSTWPNQCIKSRGDALDEKKGFLFVSCAEGKAVVFDLNRHNKELSSINTDPGVDVISYNTGLGHLYFSSSKNATLTVLGVSAQGGLSLWGKAQAAKRAHCVASDDQNNVWVCDPEHGQLLRYRDTLK